MKNIQRIVIFLLFGIGILLIESCSSKENKTFEKTNTSIIVQVANPSGTMQNGISASGHIEAIETANISTKIMGYILRLNVNVGDFVRSGQVLATISKDEITAKQAQMDAMLTEAESNFYNATKDYNRFIKLYDQQSASAKELENVTLQYKTAKARVEAAKQMRNEVKALLGYTTLLAPFSGTVVQKLAEVGSLTSPGMPILVIEKSGALQVSVSIPENQISHIKLNDKVKLNIKSTGDELHGIITQINPSSQFSGGQYITKIAIQDTEKKKIFSGMYVNVFIPVKMNPSLSKDDNRILVPQSAIVNKDQLKGLYTISASNTALLRWVRLGSVFGDEVEVISGLDKNEKFILTADGKLYNGAPVTIKN